VFKSSVALYLSSGYNRRSSHTLRLIRTIAKMAAFIAKAAHAPRSDTKYLTDDEIAQFFEELDADNDGSVTFEELAAKFAELQTVIIANLPDQELSLEQGEIVQHQQSSDLEKSESSANSQRDGINTFLCSLMPGCGSSLSKVEFIKHVRSWQVPSPNQNSAEDQDKHASEYEKGLSLPRRIRAYWAIHGPKKFFRLFVIALQIGFGLWQLMTYIRKPKTRAAFGWGLIVAKGSAGVLYPTLFFM
jgi:hypothetical protein